MTTTSAAIITACYRVVLTPVHPAAHRPAGHRLKMVQQNTRALLSQLTQEVIKAEADSAVYN